ncbi:MAG: hypothetical protein OEY87_02940 [Gammaproteobacteria bacterium]|nr:hypothetical protein [Gammaproteobacteria bacterium]MDH5735057.1 hypothetical protein [Gammaproteobacteria bacterium]
MNVVMIDSSNLAGEADFPMINLNKFGWEQYQHLEQNEVEQRCWRSDIIITAATTVDRAVIDKAFKLKLIIAAGHAYDHIDINAAQERGIKVCHVPELDPSDKNNTAKICSQVIDNINAFIQGEPINRVA